MGQDAGGHQVGVVQDRVSGCRGDSDGGSGDARKGPDSDTLHPLEAKLSA